MPEFDYKAAKRDGSTQEGRLEAASQEAALRQLRMQGLTPIRLAAASGVFAERAQKQSGGLFRRGQPGAREVLAMTNDLSVLLRAGLPLDRAFGVMIGINAHPGMTQVMADLLESVKGGRSLSQALEKHQELFGDFYINMIRAGETGGQLVEVFARLVEHLERSRELRESIVSALIYPAILIVVAILSVALMLGFVVPQFESVFADMGESLPLPTRIIIALGDGVAAYGWLLLLLVVAMVFGWRHWSRTPAGIQWRDRRILRLPLLGPVLLKYQVTRFARTLGSLLHGGVPLLDALRIAIATLGNKHLRDAMVEVPSAIKAGGRMAGALQDCGFFPGMALQVVQIGEEAGKLDTMLLELARVYDGEVQAGVKRALTMLEPVIIFVMGALIAAIILSILMGIMSVNELAV